MRYKRYSRRYKRSTNVIRMKFQSFMDISTKADEMQIISVSAGGKNILERLPAQFAAYKYYKIGNIAVKLVPASTLPVDPTGLSIAAGDNLVDPRDQLTPGMMRITNGEDVFENISGLSADEQHAIYNSMLLDPRWFKWMLQSGVKRHATPRYWQIGQLHQDKWPGATFNVPQYSANPVNGSNPALTGTTAFNQFGVAASESTATGTANNVTVAYSNTSSFPTGFFQTGHKGVLGWLPTDGLEHMLGTPTISAPPEVEVMKIILPPAYKTKYYYRMFITETVYFKEPLMQAIGTTDFPYRPLDVFHRISPGEPTTPDDSTAYTIQERDTGGNYGDD